MPMIEPALLLHNDGTKVSRASWNRRREELYEAIVPHEYGGMPPIPQETECVLLSKSAVRGEGGIGFHTYEVRSRFEEGELSFLLNLWIPVGDGPYPVVLDGDGCWRYFNDDVIPLGSGYLASLVEESLPLPK